MSDSSLIVSGDSDGWRGVTSGGDCRWCWPMRLPFDYCDAEGPAAGCCRLSSCHCGSALDLPVQLEVICSRPGCSPGWCHLAWAEYRSPYARRRGRRSKPHTCCTTALSGAQATLLDTLKWWEALLSKTKPYELIYVTLEIIAHNQPAFGTHSGNLAYSASGTSRIDWRASVICCRFLASQRFFSNAREDSSDESRTAEHA